MKLKGQIVILTTDEMQAIIDMLTEYQITLHKKTKGKYQISEETERRYYNLLETSKILAERGKQCH